MTRHEETKMPKPRQPRKQPGKSWNEVIQQMFAEGSQRPQAAQPLGTTIAEHAIEELRKLREWLLERGHEEQAQTVREAAGVIQALASQRMPSP